MRIDLKKIIAFVGVSGIGWVIDVVVYNALVYFFSATVFISNVCSAGLAVTFVFIISVKKIFLYKGNIILGLVIYLLYQGISIFIFSLLIEKINFFIIELSTLKMNMLIQETSPFLSKLVATPFNLLTNYLFMRVLGYFIAHKKHPQR